MTPNGTDAQNDWRRNLSTIECKTHYWKKSQTSRNSTKWHAEMLIRIRRKKEALAWEGGFIHGRADDGKRFSSDGRCMRSRRQDFYYIRGGVRGGGARDSGRVTGGRILKYWLLIIDYWFYWFIDLLIIDNWWLIINLCISMDILDIYGNPWIPWISGPAIGSWSPL